MRINNSGHFEYCRWATKNHDRTQGIGITQISPDQYFHAHMEPIRQTMLEGQAPAGCAECTHMEQHGKISGRQKQLLKIGVHTDHFAKGLRSSPWIDTLVSKEFDLLPQDWQIDLGNYCNSACVFCAPQSSSRLAQEWKKIGFIDKLPPANWTDDLDLVQKFVKVLASSKHIQYLHFIGGETLITPAFKHILESLIASGLHRRATIGFTTNLTVWDESVIDLLAQFHSVQLGMSIETFDPVNEYVRWPANQTRVIELLELWRAKADQLGWLLQLRTTPTILTISNLLSIYDYAWDKNICVEACNFLTDPWFLRPSLLPHHYRKPIIDLFRQWLQDHEVNGPTIVNIRHPGTTRLQNHQDLTSYLSYLERMPDESEHLPTLMDFLHKLENNRGNNILRYLPQYEELFRSAGY